MSGIPSPSPVRSNNGDRDKDSMWYFTAEDLANSPSRRYGITPDQELSYRQMTAYLIQDMGQRLQVSQLCINTAIVYMHRFYAFHSFTHFHRNSIAAASLFLAAKVEEQPRKLEHVIRAANKCLSQPTTSTSDAYYVEQAQDLVFNENVLLQTLGFDVAIDHPHTHVVKTCHLVKACKELAQTSYFLASNSLHLTSMCLQYKPTVVACFCIYLACKWSRWEIPQSTEGKHWFHYVDETVTMDLLKKLTDEFITIYEKSPARLKAKLNSIKAMAQGASNNRQGQVKEKKGEQDWKMADMMKMYQPAGDNGPVSGASSSQSSSQYGGQGSAANDQSQQNMAASMLPPPPHQPPPPQQMRKSEMHSSSSQHRSHHSSSSSSSSSSSHHPPKIGYPAGDVPDHKLSAGHKQQQQQQPPYGTNLVNRQRDHSSSSSHNQSSMMAPSSKSSSSSSSSRSSMSSGMVGQQLPRQSSQGHSMDVNYHKSRDRNIPPQPTGSHSLPPHSLPHKMAQKQQDSGRSMAKDHSGRMPAEQQQQSKQNSSSNNKAIFSSSSSSSQQYGSTQQIPPGGVPNQVTNKLEAIHDMSRNMMQQHLSRGYNQPPPSQQSTNGPPNNLLSFHQQQQGSRHSSSSNSNNNNLSNSSSLKHEQSKQLSVHMQQPTQTSTHNHKQLIPPESSYSGMPPTQHDMQQQSHTASSLSNNYCKIEPLPHSGEDHTMQQFSSHQNPVTKTVSSMFSPEWNEKVPEQQDTHAQQQQSHPPQQQSKQHQIPQNLNYTNNGGMSHNLNAADGYAGYKLAATKESPPKVKVEKDTPSKKDKNRSSSNSQQDPSPNSGRNNTSSSGVNQPQPMLKSVKLEGQMSSLNELAGTSNAAGSIGSGGVKRPNDQQAVKSEDDIHLRDSKIRKLDNAGDTGKHSQVVNGIETNPDLVRNLLKESLCPPAVLLKTENSIITPSLQPPAELFEPTATSTTTTSVQNPAHNTSSSSATAANAALSGNSDVSAMETEDHGTSGGKSEKKKKKDKHKHKEKDKDKSKDREERKKHKKDKDRHKDKEREKESESAEHVKIKISKEKLESAGEPIGFKIKIPKDRIMGDLSSQPTTSHSSHTDAAPPVLKIKISKDKLETYSSGTSSSDHNVGAQATHPSYSHNSSSQSSSAYAPYGGSSHSSSTNPHSSSSSSKKKDRDREKDRERDKEKKRHESSSKSSCGSGSSSLNPNVNTGSMGPAANGSLAGGSHSSSSNSGGTSNGGNGTTQKTQYSSKLTNLKKRYLKNFFGRYIH
ncbi:cyclin-T-like isoform X2 [Musca domestica]|uniref:Cyclin-T-like isoform X2 n=1 Tax=Musca domestica TaxID=7370 RepID=A0ABM3UQA6_MUSDO|nr:cyclin-T-like isoform X2 [Musca domestica]